MTTIKRIHILAVAAMCALFSAFAPTPASAWSAHIYTHNTSDAYAWVTAYSGSFHSGVQGAWCVPPGKYDKHGLSALVRYVYIEVSQGRCQGHIIAKEELDTRNKANVQEYRVTGHSGQYVIGGPYNV
jgi:hypothetical protein